MAAFKRKHKHGPLGTHVDCVNPTLAEHYCSICRKTGTYSELAATPCIIEIEKPSDIITFMKCKSTPDKINSGFEFLGGVFLLLHVIKAIQDKSVAGVSIVAVLFFTIWGYWNLYYYKSIKQRWSLFASVLVTLVNTVWFILLLYYRR